MPSLFSFLPGRKPSMPLLEDEGRDVVVAAALRVGDREHDADVAHRAVGGEGLGAVQDPAAVDLARPACGCRRRRSRPAAR